MLTGLAAPMWRGEGGRTGRACRAGKEGSQTSSVVRLERSVGCSHIVHELRLCGDLRADQYESLRGVAGVAADPVVKAGETQVSFRRGRGGGGGRPAGEGIDDGPGGMQTETSKGREGGFIAAVDEGIWEEAMKQRGCGRSAAVLGKGSGAVAKSLQGAWISKGSEVLTRPQGTGSGLLAACQAAQGPPPSAPQLPQTRRATAGSGAYLAALLLERCRGVKGVEEDSGDRTR